MNRDSNFSLRVCFLIAALIIVLVPAGRPLEHLVMSALKPTITGIILLSGYLIFQYYRILGRHFPLKLLIAHQLCLCLWGIFFFNHVGVIFAEYIHIPLYAGLYATASGAVNGTASRKRLLGFSVGLIICAVDELFQCIAPTRVGDLRDLQLNSAALLLGVCIMEPLNRVKRRQNSGPFLQGFPGLTPHSSVNL